MLKSPPTPKSSITSHGWEFLTQTSEDAAAVTLISPSGSQFHFVVDKNDVCHQVIPGDFVRVVGGSVEEIVHGDKVQRVHGRTLIQGDDYIALSGKIHFNHPKLKEESLPASLPVLSHPTILNWDGRPATCQQ